MNEAITMKIADTVELLRGLAWETASENPGCPESSISS